MSDVSPKALFDLVVVSNRLPVPSTAAGVDTPAQLTPGGLVAAVAPALRGRGAAWVGWPGGTDGTESPLTVEGITLYPVALSPETVEHHYEGYSNSTLWPLFHDVGVEPQFRATWWDAYRVVNERFAEKAASIAAHGAVVWVHDYQMMLVPRLLRQLRPDLTIGYFHHIPLCSPERFRELPEFSQILKGIADSDIVGFQRSSDTAHFLACAEALSEDGSSSPVAKTYPISIDYSAVAAASATPAVLDRAQELRESWGNPTAVFLGADRLDYTKGIPERLEAYESLLSSGRLTPTESVFVQAGSPSRENVESYRALQERIEAIVARINTKFRSDNGRPAVVYMASNLEREEMLSLFVEADVMVVSALRDGMNLVAKEYVACRTDETGVLVLSTRTGAADSMTEALLVDPTDSQALADTMMRASHLSASEQRQRMRALRAEVMEHDVAWWADRILSDLASAANSR